MGSLIYLPRYKAFMTWRVPEKFWWLFLLISYQLAYDVKGCLEALWKCRLDVGSKAASNPELKPSHCLCSFRVLAHHFCVTIILPPPMCTQPRQSGSSHRPRDRRHLWVPVSNWITVQMHEPLICDRDKDLDVTVLHHAEVHAYFHGVEKKLKKKWLAT